MKYLVISLVFFFCFLFTFQAVKSVNKKNSHGNSLTSDEDFENSSDEVNYNEPAITERKSAGVNKIKSDDSPRFDKNNNDSTSKKHIANNITANNSTAYENITILDHVNSQNDDIIESICDFETKVNNTIAKIQKHLNRVETGLNQISESKTSKQKLYRKFAGFSAQINYAISELYRIKNSIELLQTSKCDNVKTLQDDFSTVVAIPKNLVEKLKDALAKTKIKMSLVILN